MKSSSLDIFTQLSQNIKREQWEAISQELIKFKFIVTLGQLEDILDKHGDFKLSKQQKVFIHETYKTKKSIDDTVQNIDDKLVNVKDLVSSKLTRKNRRIDDLIALQQEKIQAIEDQKLKGLQQVDEKYLIPYMA